MVYSKQTWADGVAGGTPLSASRLQHIEDGIEDLSDDLYTGTAWTSYTPSLQNITLGNGSLSCAWSRSGKTIFFRFRFTMGSTSSMGSGPTFTLPTPAISASAAISTNGFILDSGTDFFAPLVTLNSTSIVAVNVVATSGSYASRSFIGATVPMTWTTNDQIAIAGVYEAA